MRVTISITVTGQGPESERGDVVRPARTDEESGMSLHHGAGGGLFCPRDQKGPVGVTVISHRGKMKTSERPRRSQPASDHKQGGVNLAGKPLQAGPVRPRSTGRFSLFLQRAGSSIFSQPPRH